jgi:tetratricopeptide (TPR) repeat protein
MKLGSATGLVLAVTLGAVSLLTAEPQGTADAPVTQPPPAKSSRTQNSQQQNSDNQNPPKSPGSAGAPGNSAPPRSDEQSSSEQTRVDLSPPKADELAHPDGGFGDATGVHEWNPLRAMKDVEVGDYYYRAGNYKAALSRYHEALEYKPRDAVATFKLAQTMEKSRRFDEARAEYKAYLAILKDGPSAAEARKALRRLGKH